MDTALQVSQASRQALLDLDVPARPRVDPADVAAPDGCVVEPVMVGLSVPNSLAFSADGTLYVCEGGNGWPARPFTGARILALEPSGRVTEVVRETEGPLLGITEHAGAIYATMRTPRENLVVKYDVGTGKRETIVNGLPGGGIHPPNDPVVGPDGHLYFSQGAVSLNGIPDATGFLMGFYDKHPMAADVPGEDVTLTGFNARGPDPSAPFPLMVESTAFKPFGRSGKKGEKIAGSTLASASVLRVNLDANEVELLAWGIREAFGLAFDTRGELYASNFCMEENGIRPIGNDPGAVFHIGKAQSSFGNVGTPDWYGFPDYCNDGLSVTAEKHLPARGPSPQPLIENPPKVAGKAAYLNEPHTGMGRMDFNPGSSFPGRGDLYLCQFGSFYPMNSPTPSDANNGFNVVRVNVENGTSETFLHNKKPGPASNEVGRGGIERPIDCKFGPDGKSLYVLDYGRMQVASTNMVSFGHTGVLWRVTPEGEVGA